MCSFWRNDGSLLIKNWLWFIPDLLEQLGIDKPLGNKKLYIRYGPVETGRGFVLHSDEVIQRNTFYWKRCCVNKYFRVFEDLSKVKVLLTVYSSWVRRLGPGQIEKELLANSWMTLAADSTFLFDDEVANKWNKAYSLLGIDPNKLSQFSGRA